MQFLIRLIRLALVLYEAMIIGYVLITWLKPAANRWTELLRRFTEPVLSPLRVAIISKLPSKYQILDWSPAAALILCELIGLLLNRIASIFA